MGRVSFVCHQQQRLHCLSPVACRAGGVLPHSAPTPLLLPLQLGSWVPASSCVLSVFDGVFCRMGASDCLLLGRSTFAEELGDASHILASATNRCVLVVVDCCSPGCRHKLLRCRLSAVHVELSEETAFGHCHT